MIWKTVFKIHQKQEKEEKEKLVTDNRQQVSQFTLFLIFAEIKQSCDESLGRTFDNIEASIRKPITGFLANPTSIEGWL